MFKCIVLFNTGVAFARHVLSFLRPVAMETNGTTPTLVYFWTFVQAFLPNPGITVCREKKFFHFTAF